SPINVMTQQGVRQRQSAGTGGQRRRKNGKQEVRTGHCSTRGAKRGRSSLLRFPHIAAQTNTKYTKKQRRSDSTSLAAAAKKAPSPNDVTISPLRAAGADPPTSPL
ncbi:MAG: hypothetical protein P4N59_33485, partial [Negativicutes bacterium]|nr:hypothetical protein [Negativicutes bacterium]